MAAMSPLDATQSLDNLRLERDAIVLYDALAEIEKDPRRASAFRRIAANERRHAAIWARKLSEQGVVVPPAGRPRARVRFIIVVARLFGTHAVAELVKALEGDEEEIYEGQGASPEVAAIAEDEREHARIWDRLTNRTDLEDEVTKGTGSPATASASTERAIGGDGPGETPTRPPAGALATVASTTGVARYPARDGVAAARQAANGAEIGEREQWHRAGARSGTLRAVIFGVSDGLVSNLSLVMGVAGATAEQPRFILLAGLAGLLAGAFSMAAGEYISMQSQRELFERQIALERAEMEAMPEEEEAELAAVYRSKGFTHDEAATIAHRIFRDKESALDTLVREELGLDPDELGSPWGAALGSFLSFAVGALVPVIPYFFGGGFVVAAASLALSLVALFAVGAAVSLLTGRGLVYSGMRQLGIGLAAALVTYLVGRVIGVSTGG
jgi:VIT1/CCC1 family predicted Fe2+/Mn2+ transporter/rubrerythrin